jgi:ribonuclease R
MKEGAIDFDTPEVRVVLDDRGHPVEVIRKDRKESNRLIEELMLLANRTVAEHVGKRLKRPLMYRVHDAPHAEKMGTLAEYVRAFGYHLALNEQGVVSREALNRLLAHFKGTPEDVVISTAAIQAMAKAVYSPDNIGHYGLGFRHYAHFTSPIRRYPDLVVHRLLRRYAAGHLDGVSTDQLRVQGKHLSDREREATEAERDSVRLKQVEYAAGHLGEVFDGVVVGVTKFGAFVELTRLLVEGLVHVRDMDDDFWEYDARRYALVGQSTRRVIRLGQEVRVQVVAASPALRRVDLRFATDGDGAARRDAGRDAGRDGRDRRERKGRHEKLRKGGAHKGRRR